MIDLPVLEKPIKYCKICRAETTTNIVGRCRGCHQAMIADSKRMTYGKIQNMDIKWVPFTEAPKKAEVKQEPGDMQFKYQKVCIICGAEFGTNYPGQKACSMACTKERCRRNSRASYQRNHVSASPSKHTCLQCGAVFTLKGYGKYCSDECREAHMLEYQKQLRMEHPHKPKRKICVVCGKEFELQSAAEKCCSPECRNENRLAGIRLRKKKKRAAAKKAAP